MAARSDYRKRAAQRRYRERRGPELTAYKRAWQARARLYVIYLPRELQTIAELCGAKE